MTKIDIVSGFLGAGKTMSSLNSANGFIPCRLRGDGMTRQPMDSKSAFTGSSGMEMITS